MIENIQKSEWNSLFRRMSEVVKVEENDKRDKKRQKKAKNSLFCRIEGEKNREKIEKFTNSQNKWKDKNIFEVEEIGKNKNSLLHRIGENMIVFGSK